jgi:peptidoglycan hydrolase CwlO-like protein
MSIDKFGRSNRYELNDNFRTKIVHSALPLTIEGHYNIQGKKLCNVKSPTDSYDVVNKHHLDVELKQLRQEINVKFNHVQDNIKRISALTRQIEQLNGKISHCEAKIISLSSFHYK